MTQRLSKKIFNICILAVIIVIILFVAIMFALDYNVNGESNMPFKISKISIVSTVNGQDVENSSYKWSIKAIQNNDIYIYVEKNEGYNKQETISSVCIDNFLIKTAPAIGILKIYKPTLNDTSLFQNIEENETNSITFNGAISTDTQNLEISNQGGLICFRCANNDLGIYTSNYEEEINYNELLKKMNINESTIRATITFNATITLNSGKIFKTEDISIDLPIENLVNEGTVGKEITDLDNVVFKRIEK